MALVVGSVIQSVLHRNRSVGAARPLGSGAFGRFVVLGRCSNHAFEVTIGILVVGNVGTVEMA